MKIPEKFNESKRSQNIREDWPFHLGYKLINTDDDLDDLFESTVVDVRVFWKNNSDTCKAVIWIKDKKGNRYGWGVGTTSGYGYHHESEAIQDAFMDMGIIFESSENFGSNGTKAQEKAIRRVGQALGYKNILLVDFNP